MSLERLERYTDGLLKAVREDTDFNELKSSAICLAIAVQEIVHYLKAVNHGHGQECDRAD